MNIRWGKIKEKHSAEISLILTLTDGLININSTYVFKTYAFWRDLELKLAIEVLLPHPCLFQYQKEMKNS